MKICSSLSDKRMSFVTGRFRMLTMINCMNTARYNNKDDDNESSYCSRVVLLQFIANKENE
jgi:hypothetical protein